MYNVTECLASCRIDIREQDDLEYLWVVVYLPIQNLKAVLIVTFYKSPLSNIDYVPHFEMLLPQLKPMIKKCLRFERGDFNIDLLHTKL